MTTVLITKATTQFLVEIHVFGSVQKKKSRCFGPEKVGHPNKVKERVSSLLRVNLKSPGVDQKPWRGCESISS